MRSILLDAIYPPDAAFEAARRIASRSPRHAFHPVEGDDTSAKHGNKLTAVQRRILSILAEQPDVSATQLAIQLDVGKYYVYATIRMLNRHGLVSICDEGPYGVTTYRITAFGLKKLKDDNA